MSISLSKSAAAIPPHIIDSIPRLDESTKLVPLFSKNVGWRAPSIADVFVILGSEKPLPSTTK